MAEKIHSVAVKRQIWFSAFFMFCPLAAARIVSVLYSYAATDILYMETILPSVLLYARQVLTAIAFGAGIASVAAAVFRLGEKCSAAVFGIHAGLLLADALAAFLIDVISGAVSAPAAGFTFVVGLLGFLWDAVLSFAAWITARQCLKRKKSAARALLLGTLFYMAGRLLLEIVYLIEFLIEVDFLPYSTEIPVIVGEFLSIIVISGGVVWLAACAAHALLARFARTR